MDLQIKGKRVLVIGSSTGLGFAIAQAYAEEGALVAITSRDLKRAEEASVQVINSRPFVCDLIEENAAHLLLEKVGPIDILITNTGGPRQGSFVDLSPEDWNKGYHSLWRGTIDAIHAALPSMQNQKWGRIILSTSTSAREPIPRLTLSNAYRAGLLGVMKTVSQEVAAFGITVNAMMPGYTKTKHLEALNIPEKSLAALIPAKRLGLPQELAALAVFLGSQQAAYITGQAIACDGGLIRGI